MRAVNKLSSLKISSISKPGLYADGLGLYLQVSQGGTKSWLFRFMRDGRARKMGLGPVHTVTLAMAREKALACRRTLLEDVDPIDARAAMRQAKRVDAAKSITFEDCAAKYIAAHQAGWRNTKHAKQWAATLETYAFPFFGKLPVASVDLPLVLKVLEPIWTAKPETASRVRGRIESVLDWASARGYRTGDNPARWRGHLDKLLPARSKIAKVRHHPALPYAALAGFLDELRGLEGVSPKALEFAILTAARTGETVGARWSEINLDQALWVIPRERMKGGREHRVPLAERTIHILKSLPRDESDFIFLGDKAGRPLSTMALLMTLRRMGKSDLTVHGFRSTFRDWAAEQTAYPNELVEMALAHVVSDKTEAAYRRGDMVEKRRRLMRDWADFCTRPGGVTDNVLPLRGGGNG